MHRTLSTALPAQSIPNLWISQYNIRLCLDLSSELDHPAACASPRRKETVDAMSPTETRRGRLTELASATLPTRFGDFRMMVFRWDDPQAHPALSNEHIAMVVGDVQGAEDVPVRLHSECLTSEVFGSLKCDCKQQLETAQQEISDAGTGVLLYLRQEGRGIGLANKIRAYSLQEQGADTVDANTLLHLPVDARTYDVAAAILEHLGVASVTLFTNNPEKVEALKRLGIDVKERRSIVVDAGQHARSYLEVKRLRMQHDIPSTPPSDVPPKSGA